MNITEARCRRCGETFNPHGDQLDDPEHVEHYARENGDECGGDGFVTGTWRFGGG